MPFTHATEQLLPHKMLTKRKAEGPGQKRRAPHVSNSGSECVQAVGQTPGPQRTKGQRT